MVFGWVFVMVFVCITDILALFSSLWAADTRMHINALSIGPIMKVYKHVELIRFRKNSDFIDIGNFEVGKIQFRDCRVYEIGLIAIRDESPMFCAGAPDVSGHEDFGTRHFGTYSIRQAYIVTSGHSQFGTQSLRHLSYRDKHDSVLHNYYVKYVYTCSSHGKSVQAPIRL